MNSLVALDEACLLIIAFSTVSCIDTATNFEIIYGVWTVNIFCQVQVP